MYGGGVRSGANDVPLFSYALKSRMINEEETMHVRVALLSSHVKTSLPISHKQYKTLASY